MDLDIHYVDDEQVLASCGPLLLRIIERAQTTNQDVERVLTLAEALAAKHERIGVLIVIHHGAPIPSRSVLRNMGETRDRLGERGAVVFVTLGLGFWAMAAQHSLLTLANFAGVHVPVETDLDSAARRVSRRIPGLTPSIVTTVYEKAAAKMVVRPPI